MAALRFVLLVILLTLHLVTVAQAKPNIVFVYTDDQAAWAVGHAVENGWFDDVPAAYTPHIDQLAQLGAVFRNSFCTTPVCSPARASIMTGRYASEFGIEDFIASPSHKLFDPANQITLDPNASLTFAEVLQKTGYRTGLVGKWHLGDWTLDGHQKFHPTNHGFDKFMGLTSGGTSPSNPTLEHNGVVKKFAGLTTDILTDHALEFIDAAAEQPFLLCFHTRAPHAAWLPVADEDWKPYKDLDPTIPNPTYPDLNVMRMKKQMREYLACTTGVDRNLGRILDRLDSLGLSQNTIVIFTSDHGYTMGHNGIWHKGNGIWATKKTPRGTHQGTAVVSDKYRPNMYDHSLRVPLIVRWPGVVQPGTVIDHTTSGLDIFPTILSMASATTSDSAKRFGRDLTPLLKGKQPLNWDNDLYAEYHMVNYAEANMRCYRTPRYKLIRDVFNVGRSEFYDLANDPDETSNLIGSEDPAIRAAVHELDLKLRLRRQQIVPRVRR